jgi:hypothetical protein
MYVLYRYLYRYYSCLPQISQPDGDSNLDGGDIVFNVTIFLPGGNPAAPITYLSHFETDMPSFTHNFAMTDMRIRFGHVTLRSADAPIIVEVSFHRHQ